MPANATEAVRQRGFYIDHGVIAAEHPDGIRRGPELNYPEGRVGPSVAHAIGLRHFEQSPTGVYEHKQPAITDGG